MRPTDEQVEILEAFAGRGTVVVEAVAGSGKTSTLRLCAGSTDRRGLYLAFNKAIATEAQRSFPDSVTASTAHSIAFRAHGYRYKHRLNMPRMTNRDIAKKIGITRRRAFGEKMLTEANLARIVKEAVQRFCWSDSLEITEDHVPYFRGLDWGAQGDLAYYIKPYAVAYWDDLQKINGHFRTEHDHYLKSWALTNPKFDIDYLLIDEVQDLNPVLATLVREQRHLQVVAVGDSAQQLYAWRGAEDALDSFGVEEKLALTLSFRFGPAIAEVANEYLAELGSELRVRGLDSVESTVGNFPNARAVLMRTNAGALDELLSALKDDRKVHIVGGATDVLSFCRAVTDLKAGRGTTHPELFLFRTWGEVQDHVEEEPDTEFALLVKLVEEYDADTIADALTKTVPAEQAELLISTTHKAKGLEFPSVRIGDDFVKRRVTKDDEPLSPELLRLCYVAVTRAQHELDLGSLRKVAHGR